MIFEVAGVQPELLATNEKEYRTAARRPKYSALANAKMERAGLDPLPPYARRWRPISPSELRSHRLPDLMA